VRIFLSKLNGMSRNAKDSDDGVQHPEVLGFWTLSIVRDSKYSDLG
jgi:hypothetical protein